MATVYLGIGSNLGNRQKNIERALDELRAIDFLIEQCSSIIETDPVDSPFPQSKFLNAVLRGTTTLSPNTLLKSLKDIEQRMGREETVRNGPRIIDLDILLYDDLQLNTPELTIPHPRMFERLFVLEPLREIAPDVLKDLYYASH